MSAPDRIWLSLGYLAGNTGTDNPSDDISIKPADEVADHFPEYTRSDLAASEADELRAENERLRQALREISCIVSWEINPSNYTHQEVCDINCDFIEIGNTVDAALAK